jgi:site-specific DNA-methyltransferase (adenine-specific)
MEIEKINTDEVKPYENNAKLHPPEQIEQIKKSIKEFGNNDPIAIDENNIIIEGHGRYQALKELGFKEIEVIKLTHLNEQQKKAYILAHNKLTMNTGFDFDTLNLELDSILDFDMSDFGFTLDFQKQDQMISDSKEFDTNEFSDEKFECECPRCGFRWNNE